MDSERYVLCFEYFETEGGGEGGTRRTGNRNNALAPGGRHFVRYWTLCVKDNSLRSEGARCSGRLTYR
jgi:hypothetical protein